MNPWNEMWQRIMHRSTWCDCFDTWLMRRSRRWRAWRRKCDGAALQMFVDVLRNEQWKSTLTGEEHE